MCFIEKEITKLFSEFSLIFFPTSCFISFSEVGILIFKKYLKSRFLSFSFAKMSQKTVEIFVLTSAFALPTQFWPGNVFLQKRRKIYSLTCTLAFELTFPRRHHTLLNAESFVVTNAFHPLRQLSPKFKLFYSLELQLIRRETILSCNFHRIDKKMIT